jgi:hypothetical protein
MEAGGSTRYRSRTFPPKDLRPPRTSLEVRPLKACPSKSETMRGWSPQTRPKPPLSRFALPHKRRRPNHPRPGQQKRTLAHPGPSPGGGPRPVFHPSHGPCAGGPKCRTGLRRERSLGTSSPRRGMKPRSRGGEAESPWEKALVWSLTSYLALLIHPAPEVYTNSLASSTVTPRWRPEPAPAAPTRSGSTSSPKPPSWGRGLRQEEFRHSPPGPPRLRVPPTPPPHGADPGVSAPRPADMTRA